MKQNKSVQPNTQQRTRTKTNKHKTIYQMRTPHSILEPVTSKTLTPICQVLICYIGPTDWQHCGLIFGSISWLQGFSFLCAVLACIVAVLHAVSRSYIKESLSYIWLDVLTHRDQIASLMGLTRLLIGSPRAIARAASLKFPNATGIQPTVLFVYGS